MKTTKFLLITLFLISNNLFGQEATTNNKSTENENAYSFTYKNFFINPSDLNAST